MKIHERVKRGKKVWTVDGRINGKRQRSNFETKRAAEAYLKTINKEPELSAWWAGLTLTDRFDLKAAFDIAKEDGFTLLAAAQNQAVSGRGKTHLKKMTLAEAIGYSGIDRRWKNDPNAKTKSGFLGDKAMANLSVGSLNTLRSGLYNFMNFAGPDLQCTAVTAELIKSWLHAGGDKENNWKPTTQKHMSGHLRNFFNWCIRQNVISKDSNPVSQLEKINLEPFDPYVLNVDECRQILKLCHEEHAECLPLLVLNLFCGIRPSETRRLKSSKGRDCNFNWEDNEVVLKARQTKTKMRRYVEMSPNCLEWLKLQKFDLPIVNAKHKWNKFLQSAKVELAYNDGWPHDCIRHSFCSYGLRSTDNAGKVALQAGNTERVLFQHYLKLVSKADAKAFWNIFPEETLKAAS